MSPKVSILIPTYNRARYLEQAIESALRQDYPDLEVLVLDNASTDSTPALVRRFTDRPRFNYRRNGSNIGMVRNWRQGIYVADGDWFLLLSDDDYLIDEHYISKAMQIATRDPAVAIVYANGYVLDESSGSHESLTLPFNGIVDGKDVFMSRGKVSPQDFTLCNVLFARQAAIQQDAFHNPDNLSCDSELFLRMTLTGKVGVCSDYVSVYRKHSSNLIGGVHLNFDQLVHNTEMVFLPYQHAEQSGRFSAEELDDWYTHAAKPHLSWILNRLRRHHPLRLREGMRYFEDQYGQLFWRGFKKSRRVRYWATALFYACLAQISSKSVRPPMPRSDNTQERKL